MLRGIYISILHNNTLIKNKERVIKYPAFFGNKAYFLKEKNNEKSNNNVNLNFELRVEPNNKKEKSVLLGYNTIYYSYFNNNNKFSEDLNSITEEIKKKNLHKTSNRNFMFILFIYDDENDIFKSFYKEAKKKIEKELNVDDTVIQPLEEAGSFIENISNDKMYHYYTDENFENSEVKKNSDFLNAYFLSRLFFYFNLNYNFINRRTIYRFFYYWKKNRKNEPLLLNKSSFFKIFSYIKFTYYSIYFLFHLFNNENFIYDVLLYLFPNHEYYDYYALEFYRNNSHITKPKLFKEKLINLWETLPTFTMAYIGSIIAILALFIGVIK